MSVDSFSLTNLKLNCQERLFNNYTNNWKGAWRAQQPYINNLERALKEPSSKVSRNITVFCGLTNCISQLNVDYKSSRNSFSLKEIIGNVPSLFFSVAFLQPLSIAIGMMKTGDRKKLNSYLHFYIDNGLVNTCSF